MADSREKARLGLNKTNFSPAKGFKSSGFNTFDGRGVAQGPALRQNTNPSEKKLKIVSSKQTIKTQTFHHQPSATVTSLKRRSITIKTQDSKPIVP